VAANDPETLNRATAQALNPLLKPADTVLRSTFLSHPLIAAIGLPTRLALWLRRGWAAVAHAVGDRVPQYPGTGRPPTARVGQCLSSPGRGAAEQGAPNQTRGMCVKLVDSHRVDGSDEMSVRRLTACLVVCSLGSVIAPVTASASVVASNARTHEYRLPTDGWKPGDSAVTAALFGRFHATLTTSGACAWMATPHQGTVYLWPVGYRVRFHPTALLGPNGKVVAHQDQKVNAGGGEYSRQAAASLSPSPAIPEYCGTANNVILIESPVVEGQGLQ
jgi:hypothetical protein